MLIRRLTEGLLPEDQIAGLVQARKEEIWNARHGQGLDIFQNGKLIGTEGINDVAADLKFSWGAEMALITRRMLQHCSTPGVVGWVLHAKFLNTTLLALAIALRGLAALYRVFGNALYAIVVAILLIFIVLILWNHSIHDVWCAIFSIGPWLKSHAWPGCGIRSGTGPPS